MARAHDNPPPTRCSAAREPKCTSTVDRGVVPEPASVFRSLHRIQPLFIQDQGQAAEGDLCRHAEPNHPVQLGFPTTMTSELAISVGSPGSTNFLPSASTLRRTRARSFSYSARFDARIMTSSSFHSVDARTVAFQGPLRVSMSTGVPSLSAASTRGSSRSPCGEWSARSIAINQSRMNGPSMVLPAR